MIKYVSFKTTDPEEMTAKLNEMEERGFGVVSTYYSQLKRYDHVGKVNGEVSEVWVIMAKEEQQQADDQTASAVPATSIFFSKKSDPIM